MTTLLFSQVVNQTNLGHVDVLK